ncbi:hypothetical protein QBC40DRAFT_353105 [Triangularia verruculosa]|uniref:Nephrocystin 3-like N-terminal domain-containing protein n=1 Tax=Triangularia verruculosa TaxID=2587418 RepID=A0AAN7APJ9_9PEZI|nr:hypothetical protein QBC40DRAFT_353105 [Triangularia verruculosa]
MAKRVGQCAVREGSGVVLHRTIRVEVTFSCVSLSEVLDRGSSHAVTWVRAVTPNGTEMRFWALWPRHYSFVWDLNSSVIVLQGTYKIVAVPEPSLSESDSLKIANILVHLSHLPLRPFTFPAEPRRSRTIRLLERDNTGEIRPTKDLPSDKIPLYTILSYTWGPDEEEVSYKDLEDGRASNSTELQEAINFMFRWYRDAAKCYVYLTDVSTCKRDADGIHSWKWAFRRCRWFTRGWTLQELIAPTSVEFFSREKVRIGDRNSLEQMIHDVTEVPLEALRGSPLSDFSVYDRMAWMKQRNTIREEDMAYSLFGIFDVHLPLIYGEGKEKALERLREKIGKEDCLADLRSTDPRLDKKRIEEAKGGLVTNAYRWILDNPDFNRWRNLPESRLFWIKGDPGKGKTMLLCGIIKELEEATITDRHCCNLAYFFC